MADIKELAAALVALQGDLEAVEKTASNPFFKSKYADLPTVMAAVQPLLKKHELAVSQFITHIEGQSALRTILMHTSGQFIEDTMPLLLPKSDPQGQGSAITYARRYSFMAVLGVVADEDDDGNKASKKPAATPKLGMTQAQLNKIHTLGAELELPKDALDMRVADIKTEAEAEEAIKKLEKQVKEREGKS